MSTAPPPVRDEAPEAPAAPACAAPGTGLRGRLRLGCSRCMVVQLGVLAVLGAAMLLDALL